MCPPTISNINRYLVKLSLVFSLFMLMLGQSDASDEEMTLEQARMKVTYARENLKKIEKEYDEISNQELSAMDSLRRAEKKYKSAKAKHVSLTKTRKNKKVELDKAREILDSNREKFKSLRSKR